MPSLAITLRPHRENPILRGSAWIFASSVATVSDPSAPPGTPVLVHSADGRPLGSGLWNPLSDLRVRLLGCAPDRAPDADSIRALVFSAVSARHALHGAPSSWTDTTGWRMVFSEADGLSGVIADQFADVLSVQLASPVWVPWWPTLRDALRDATSARLVTLRPSPATREPLDLSSLPSDTPPSPLWFRESGCEFLASPADGQKTGFYLDQRENRRRVASLARGRRVLSADCYTGAFEVLAGAAGAASVTGWDASAPALDAARLHHERNHTPCPYSYEVADVPTRLRLARDRGETWNLIILDPPRLASSRASVPRALRAYKDINLLALKLLAPGGLLATFSCSGLVDAATFRQAVGWAARDSGRPVRLLTDFTQPDDHPRLPESPDCDYLKGLLLLVP